MNYNTLYMCEHELNQLDLLVNVNRHSSNVHSRCGPGNARFISIRQVSLVATYRFSVFLLLPS